MDRTAFVRKVPLFSGIGGRDLGRLGRIGKPRCCRAGETIFSEHAAGDKLFIVVSGRVKIFSSVSKRNKTLAYLERGEFFGEMSLLDNELRSASAAAIEESELLVISKREFRALLERYPGISFQIMRTLSRRLRQADREIESLAFGRVLGRVAAALIGLSKKYGEKTPDGLCIKMPLNHRDIAEIAGTGREMVSRILNRFRRLEYIRYGPRYLTITNASKLKEWID